jgi:hypothetical protein
MGFGHPCRPYQSYFDRGRPKTLVGCDFESATCQVLAHNSAPICDGTEGIHTGYNTSCRNPRVMFRASHSPRLKIFSKAFQLDPLLACECLAGPRMSGEGRLLVGM